MKKESTTIYSTDTGHFQLSSRANHDTCKVFQSIKVVLYFIETILMLTLFVSTSKKELPILLTKIHIDGKCLRFIIHY